MITGDISLGSKRINLSEKKNFKDQNRFKKIFKKTGIKIIYEATQKENSLTLAEKAGKKILKKINEKIESLIFVSQSHVSTIPSSSNLLHERLKLEKNCFLMDVVQGCSGFPYALITASNLINSGSVKNSLIICSETYRKYISKKDITCGTVFSDGASAIFFNKRNLPRTLSTFYHSDGSGAKNLCLTEEKGKNKKLYMHGSNVFTFTNQNIPLAVNKLLQKSQLKIDDVGFFIFHQASSIVLNTLREKLKIPENKFYNRIRDVGNTVSSTIPIALIDSNKRNILPIKKPIMIIGFGVGYSVCGGVFIFDKK